VVAASGQQSFDGDTRGGSATLNPEGGPEVWYAVDVEGEPVTANVLVRGDDDWDTFLYALGGDCDELAFVDANDNHPDDDGPGRSLLDLDLAVGRHFFVVAGLVPRAAGTFGITFTFGD